MQQGSGYTPVLAYGCDYPLLQVDLRRTRLDRSFYVLTGLAAAL